MTEIKGVDKDMEKAAHKAADKDPVGRDGQKRVRLARPDEEARIKRERRSGDWRNMAKDDREVEKCVSAKDLETHTRLARPDEEAEIKARHAKKRAEAAGQTMPPLSAKQQQAAADEAAASVARRLALGGV
jgi:hypothetical protein